MKDAFANMCIAFELQTFSGGSGSPSYFGSGGSSSGGSNNNNSYINNEEQLLENLANIFANTEVIAQMQKLKIVRIYIKNPYGFNGIKLDETPYASVRQRIDYSKGEMNPGFSDDSTFIVSLYASEDTIQNALENYKPETPIVPGFSTIIEVE